MPAQAILRPSTNVLTPARAGLPDPIRILGELLDDLEQVRIANGLRIGAAQRAFGGDAAMPQLVAIQDALARVEHDAELELKRAWRIHPLAAWAKGYHGLGEKSIARLIAIVGDPAERPNVAKLWAYSGHGNPNRTRAKGMTQAELFKLGNPRAKKQVWLIATSLLKAGNRERYDARRAVTADRLHERPCVRCGPAGKPAATGSPWSLAHQHHDALRIVGKGFLKDLWIAARQSRTEAQDDAAGGDPE